MRVHPIARLMPVWGALLMTGARIALGAAPAIFDPQVVMSDPSSAWVTFTTSVPAKATVEYHSVNGALRTVEETEFDTGHALPLAGLIPGLQYEGTITVTAEDGSTADAPVPPFTAMEPQVDVGFQAAPQVFFTGPDEAVIAFATNTLSTAQLDFGRNGMLDQSLTSDEPAKTHAFTLSHLLLNETYTFRVTVKGADGSIAVTPPATFKAQTPDTDLGILGPEVFQTGEAGAWLIFRTTRPAKATAELWSATLMVQSVSETAFDTDHALMFTGLVTGQTYTVRITATGDDGSTAVAFVPPFVATDVPRDIGFVIPPQVLVTGPDQAVVAFTTNGDATARVDYGLNGALSQTVTEDAPTRNHALTLPGLQPGATYTYTVTVRAADGSVFTTAPATFKAETNPAEFGSGDVDGDGFVDVRDVVTLLRYVVGILPLSTQQRAAAEVTGDAQVDVQDAVQILRAVVGVGS